MQISNVLQTGLWIFPKFEVAHVWSQGWEAAKATCRDYIYIQPSPSFGSIQTQGFGCGPLPKFSRIRCLPWVPRGIVWSPSFSVTFKKCASQVQFFLCSYFLTSGCVIAPLCAQRAEKGLNTAPKKWQKHDLFSQKLFLCNFITLVSFKKLQRELTS